MSDQNLEIEGTTTGNVASEVQTTPTEAVATETKSASLDEAIKAALAKHDPAAADTPRTALPTTDTPTADTASEAKAVDPITGRELEPIKAPAGWTPKLREQHWGKLDRELQQFLVARDTDISNRLTQTADERKLATLFKEATAPYEGFLKQFNTSALDHAKELFNLSYALNTGSPQTRAQLIVNLMQHFKPDAGTMQQLLANPGMTVMTPPPAPQPFDREAEVEKALAERDQKAKEAEGLRELSAFQADPKNEFFEDVRGLMGKIIDAGLVDADSTSELFKKAYDLACSQHPEVAQVIAARQATAITPATATPTAKPIASVKPSLGAGKSAKAPPKGMSMDDAIRAAMEQHGIPV